ncbi:hypothetical protein B0H13DRAFT_1891757 [Mycena leptocephala]|nr:hypothetical protein B0H13DRAFT_1891757 [Mycena leptocephala]
MLDHYEYVECVGDERKPRGLLRRNGTETGLSAFTARRIWIICKRDKSVLELWLRWILVGIYEAGWGSHETGEQQKQRIEMRAYGWRKKEAQLKAGTGWRSGITFEAETRMEVGRGTAEGGEVDLRAGGGAHTGSETEIDGRADAGARVRVRVPAGRGRNIHWLGRVGVGHRTASGVGWAREEEELGSSEEFIRESKSVWAICEKKIAKDNERKHAITGSRRAV